MGNETEKRQVLFLLLLTMFIVQTGVGLIVPVMPVLLEYFRLSAVQLGYLIALTGIAQLLGSPVAGWLVDSYGKRNMVIVGLILFSLSQWLCAAAEGLWLLALSRLFCGVSIACLYPAVIASITDWSPEADRAKYTGWFGAAMTLGIVIGPGIGGFLAMGGWRYPFWGAGALTIISLAFSLWFLPKEEKESLVNSAVSAKESIWRPLYKTWQPAYRPLFLLTFLFTFSMVLVEVIFPLYMVQKFSLAVPKIAFLVMIGALASAVIQWILVDKLLVSWAPKRILAYCLCLAVIGLSGMGIFRSSLFLVGSLLCFSAVIALFRPVIQVLLMNLAGAQQGIVAGVSNSYTSLAIVTAPVVAGFLFESNRDFPYLLAGLLLCICLLITKRSV